MHNFIEKFLLLSSEKRLAHLFCFFFDNNRHIQKNLKEVTLHTECSYEIHWGYVEFAQIEVETGQIHEGKWTENYCVYMTMFGKSLRCKLLEIWEYSE